MCIARESILFEEVILVDFIHLVLLACQVIVIGGGSSLCCYVLCKTCDVGQSSAVNFIRLLSRNLCSIFGVHFLCTTLFHGGLFMPFPRCYSSHGKISPVQRPDGTEDNFDCIRLHVGLILYNYVSLEYVGVGEGWARLILSEDQTEDVRI